MLLAVNTINQPAPSSVADDVKKCGDCEEQHQRGPIHGAGNSTNTYAAPGYCVVGRTGWL